MTTFGHGQNCDCRRHAPSLVARFKSGHPPGGVARVRHDGPTTPYPAWMSAPRPVRIAILNDYEVVVRGLAAMLEPYRHRVEVVELDIDGDLRHPVDVSLLDTFAGHPVPDEHLDAVVADRRSGRVVVFTWDTPRELVDAALAKGACGFLAKSTPAEDLVDAIERVAGGEVVVSGTADRGGDGTDVVTNVAPEQATGDWPGRAAGLSGREAEVLALITQGLTNEEIAQRTYLSINSVKTYIRQAYRKIGVTRRSQAVRWGVEHGMAPSSARSDLRP